MKLRIARKMDRGGHHRRAHDDRDKRVWWQVYNVDQLQRAERRLRKSWRTRCPLSAGGSRKVSPDFFASNRVEGRRIRQAVIRRLRRREAGRV